MSFKKKLKTQKQKLLTVISYSNVGIELMAPVKNGRLNKFNISMAIQRCRKSQEVGIIIKLRQHIIPIILLHDRFCEVFIFFYI